MFAAIVIVCSLVTGDCMRFDDGRGPYPTLEECKARTYEMAPVVKEFWTRTGPPGPTRIEQRCGKIGEET